MNCEMIQLRYSEYLDSPDNFPGISDHLKYCETCRDELDFFIMLKKRFDTGVPELPEFESQNNQNEIYKKVRRQSFRQAKKYILSVAAVFLIIFTSVFNLQNILSTPDTLIDYQWLAVDKYYGDLVYDVSDEALIDYLSDMDDLENIENLLSTLN